jgi:hypothetical protein
MWQLFVLHYLMTIQQVTRQLKAKAEILISDRKATSVEPQSPLKIEAGEQSS